MTSCLESEPGTEAAKESSSCKEELGKNEPHLQEDVRQRPLRLLFSDAGTKQPKDGWLPTQRSGIAAEYLIEAPFNGVSKECLVMTTAGGCQVT